MTYTQAEAAALLGMKPSEVVDVVEVDEGAAVLLFDGTEVLVVPEDRPDAAGQSGVMLRVSPGAMSRLPVYVPFPTEDDGAPAGDADDEDAREPAKPAKRAAKKAAVKAPAGDADDEDDDDA